MSYIEVKNVTKEFGSTVALDNISLNIEKGKIYGLLGRNGAGKTTLLNIMTNKLFPDNGEVVVDGEKVMENDIALGKIFSMSEANSYPERMSLSKALRWTKVFYPDMDTDYAHSLSSKFAINEGKRFRSLSTGYKSIYKLILALSSNAPVVFLDEPVLGLDANHRELFYKELLANYNENPRTFIISTHLIEEAADIIEEVIIIKEGKILLSDSVENILSQGCTVSGVASSIDEFIKGRKVAGTESLGGLKTAYLMERIDCVPAGIEVTKLNLQQIFIKLTNS